MLHPLPRMLRHGARPLALGLGLGLALLLAPAPTLAQEVDYLGLAALLMKDGHYDRAQNALDNVDVEDPQLDRKRYQTLRGLVALRNQDHAAAEGAFEQAIAAAAGQGDDQPVTPILYIYLAQAHSGQEDYAAAIAALDRGGEALLNTPKYIVFRAQTFWKMRDYAGAWNTLDAAQARFPAEPDFTRRKVFMLIELGMYQAAAELGTRYLENCDAQEADLLALGRALRNSGQLEQAFRFLEEAYLRYPDSRASALELASAHLAAGRTLAAGDILEKTAALEPELYSEAAELHRNAGKRLHALNLNARIADSRKKAQQRLALLLEMQNYEQIIAMRPALTRTGFIEEQATRYALAYAYFKTGQHTLAEQQLAQITDPGLFRKATVLRKVMAECEDSPWECI